MYILGFGGGTRQGYQDPSAVLLRDGELVAAVEEERLIRVKQAPGMLAEESIRCVLRQEGIALRDVNTVASHGLTWQPDFRLIFRDFLTSKFGCCPTVELVHHHDAHCASAYYASGFEEAMVLSVDLSGDGVSTQTAVGSGGRIRVLERYERPNSLGIFYSLLTEFCGFLKDSDEYKLMGLSAYGNRRKHDFSWLLKFGQGRYEMNTDYIKGFKPGEPGPSKQVPLYNEKLLARLGPARPPGVPMTDHYADIAASGQRHLEEVMVELVTAFHQATGLRKLCFAGGCALNVLVNQRLMNLEFIDDLFVQPAANDAGISLGAAYLVAANLGHKIKPMDTVYLGPEFSNKEIEAALEHTGARFSTTDDPAAYAARLVSENKIIGWFQGRMELGPRALGNRSILANPANKDIKDLVNVKVKFREQYRPFCPSVLEAEVPRYFKGKKRTAPYMTITYDVDPACHLPSVTHVDGTARIQTVAARQNPLFHRYLEEMNRRLGQGVTLNTSLNVKGDPIVNTPFNALATLFGSGMDSLIIGNYVVEKTGGASHRS